MREQIFLPKGNNDCYADSTGLRPKRKRRLSRLCGERSFPGLRRCSFLMLLMMLMINVENCNGFSSKSTTKSILKLNTPEIKTSRTSVLSRLFEPMYQDDKITVTNNEQQNEHFYRRRFLSQVIYSVSSGWLVSTCAFPNAARAESEVTLATSRIIRLSSGLQFSDQRVGSGPLVLIPKSISVSPGTTTKNQNSIDNSDGLEPDDPSIVLMHLKALKQDGSVLLDTFEEGKPLLFRLGSIPSELYLLNEAGAMAKGRIPLGVQDAILAQGAASWEGGFGKADPMRTGGIRKVVIPSELAYGTKGVSRYEAFQLGLKQPVARNELLRYEIELLRCNDEVMDLAGGDASMVKDDGSKSNAVAARACCLQEFYPCKMNGG